MRLQDAKTRLLHQTKSFEVIYKIIYLETRDRMGLDTEGKDVHSLHFADDEMMVGQDKYYAIYMRRNILKDNTER